MELTNKEKERIIKGIVEPMVTFERKGDERGLEEANERMISIMRTLNWCALQGLDLDIVDKFVDEKLEENGIVLEK